MVKKQFSNFNVHINHPAILLNMQIFNSVGLGRSLKFGISQGFSGDADVAGPWTILQIASRGQNEPWSQARS